MTTRRAFLGTIAAAMATAVVPMVAGATAPLTLAQQQIAQHGFAFDKYQIALKKFDLIVSNDPKHISTTMMVDDLLAFMFAEFPLPQYEDYAANREAMRWLMNDVKISTGEMEQKLRETPSPIIDVLWSVALLKVLLSQYKVRLNLDKSIAFGKFSKLYMHLIMG